MNKGVKLGLSASRAAKIEVPTPTPREVRDSAFYRKQAKNLQKELDRVEHLLEEMSGLRSVQAAPIFWKRSELTPLSSLIHLTCITEKSFGLERYLD